MINAEELKELIEKEAVIYSSKNKYVSKIELIEFDDDYGVDCGRYTKTIFIKDNQLKVEESGDEYNNASYDLKDLYETKAEAEFVAKYKNIERTEYLDLPTWEEAEIDKIVKISNNQNNCWYLIKSFTDKKNNEMFEFSLSKDDDQFYLSVNNEDSSYKDLFDNLLTYENYLKACELCKKLFMGEEV